MSRLGVLAVVLIAGTFAGQPAAAQDALSGALLGGAAGAIIGGAATGKAGGAVAGAIIGGTAGAIIGEQGRRNRRGYYAYQNGCYVQRRDGSYRAVHPQYCY
jgi:hypothetical protein